MNKEERKKYIFAQLRSLPNATQYVEVIKYIEDLEQQVEKQKEVINNFLDIVDKSKMLLNNPDLLDLYLKIKEVE